MLSKILSQHLENIIEQSVECAGGDFFFPGWQGETPDWPVNALMFPYSLINQVALTLFSGQSGSPFLILWLIW